MGQDLKSQKVEKSLWSVVRRETAERRFITCSEGTGQSKDRAESRVPSEPGEVQVSVKKGVVFKESGIINHFFESEFTMRSNC